MNGDTVAGNWKQYKGKVNGPRRNTDDHLDMIAAQRDQLAGKIRETYGIGKDEAERQIRTFEDRQPHR